MALFIIQSFPHLAKIKANVKVLPPQTFIHHYINSDFSCTSKKNQLVSLVTPPPPHPCTSTTRQTMCRRYMAVCLSLTHTQTEYSLVQQYFYLGQFVEQHVPTKLRVVQLCEEPGSDHRHQVVHGPMLPRFK